MNIIVFEKAEWGLPLATTDERAVHIREILKLKPGQSLRVGLLDSGIGVATYSGSDAQTMILSFPEPASLTSPTALLPITLLVGHPRPPVMQRLLKDLNAAGIGRIFVVASDLSEKSYMQSHLWQPDGQGRAAYSRFLVQGAQQGGLANLSDVQRFYSLDKAMAASASLPPAWRIVLDLAETGTDLLDLAFTMRSSRRTGQAQTGTRISLAIGPERGWSDRERLILHDQGFQACSLGTRILRTETACNLACGILAMALTDGE